jgi:hypothetical protein
LVVGAVDAVIGDLPWSATALRVASGMVLATSGATRPVTSPSDPVSAHPVTCTAARSGGNFFEPNGPWLNLPEPCSSPRLGREGGAGPAPRPPSDSIKGLTAALNLRLGGRATGPPGGLHDLAGLEVRCPLGISTITSMSMSAPGLSMLFVAPVTTKCASAAAAGEACCQTLVVQ